MSQKRELLTKHNKMILDSKLLNITKKIRVLEGLTHIKTIQKVLFLYYSSEVMLIPF